MTLTRYGDDVLRDLTRSHALLVLRAVCPLRVYNTSTSGLYTVRGFSNSKSQPRTGHTREPNSTHLKLKRKTTREKPTHERTPNQTNLTHTHTPETVNDVKR